MIASEVMFVEQRAGGSQVFRFGWCSLCCTGCAAMDKRYSTHSALLAARGVVNFPSFLPPHNAQLGPFGGSCSRG